MPQAGVDAGNTRSPLALNARFPPARVVRENEAASGADGAGLTAFEDQFSPKALGSAISENRCVS